MALDFNPPSSYRAKPRRKRFRLTTLLLLLTLAVPILFLFARESAPTPETLESAVEAVIQAPPTPEIRQRFIEGAIRPGDTMSSLLSDYFTPAEIHDLGLQSRGIFPLANICAGQPYKICLTDGAFERLEYDIDRDDQLIIQRSGAAIDVDRIAIEYTSETVAVQGSIRSSLFEAVDEIGESAELALALADIFAWDIDFIRDIRDGDSFKALVEKRYRDGQSAGYGRILAAEFSNQGETYQAFLFKDGDHPPSYYDAKGNSLRKAFLKAPLDFSRISSGFTLKRFHPITKTWKAHPAIDYAAPTGTPIKAVGDATISKIGYSKYNGNHIKLRHAGGYESMYLHMSRFAKGMKQGKKVGQGTVIGYVGSTGLATGPHLCFRMFKGGSPVNPNKIKSTAANPVSRDDLAAFKATVPSLLGQLQATTTLQAQRDEANTAVE